jgi:gliding motility-associated-like protein
MTYVLPADLQMYSVQVTNLNGCTATDDVRIYVEDIRRVFVATGFTPNADNSNDYLLVQGGRGTVRIKTFRVYDRWGTLVFETADAPLNDINYAWDGNFKGKPLNADVFAWYTEVEFTDGEVIAYKGNTTLIR